MMRIDIENRLIVIPKSQLRPEARKARMNAVERYDFPRSRRPLDDAEAVVVYSDKAMIFIKNKRKFDFDLASGIEDLDYFHVLFRRLSDMIAMDKMETQPLDNFDFEDIFGRRKQISTGVSELDSILAKGLPPGSIFNRGKED
jgi:hypothetical protein